MSQPVRGKGRGTGRGRGSTPQTQQQQQQQPHPRSTGFVEDNFPSLGTSSQSQSASQPSSQPPRQQQRQPLSTGTPIQPQQQQPLPLRPNQQQQQQPRKPPQQQQQQTASSLTSIIQEFPSSIDLSAQLSPVKQLQPVSMPLAQPKEAASQQSHSGGQPSVLGSSEIRTSILRTEEKSQVDGLAADVACKFPPKPKVRGDLGRMIPLKTNHYQIKMTNPITVYQYDLDIKRLVGREVDDMEKLIKIKRFMKAVFKELISKHLKGYTNKIVYNFSKNLFSLQKLPFDEESFQVEVEGSVYVLTIKTINEFSVDPRSYNNQVNINLLDLIFTHNFNYREGGDSYKLGFGVELWKGAYASVRPSEIGLTWNVDSANAAFMISKDLIDLTCNHYNCNVAQLNGKIQNDKFNGTIGYSFLETYRGREIKTRTSSFRKKIKGFGPDSSYTFDWNQGATTVKITIRDYLKKHYNIDLQYPQLPCIDLGHGSYLPLELCSTELKHKKKLTERETADIIKETAVPPARRAQYIEGWINNSGIGKDPILNEFGAQLSLKMVEVNGRVIPAPDIEYSAAFKNRVSSYKIAEKGFWDHTGFKFRNAKAVSRWVVLNHSNRVKEHALNQFIDKFISIGNEHGMDIADPLDVKTTFSANDMRFKEMLNNLVKANTLKSTSLDLILVVLGGSSNAYEILKTCCDLEFGVATQAVKEKNVEKLSDQTISNILLKVNTKLSGRNFIVAKDDPNFKKYLVSFYAVPGVLPANLPMPERINRANLLMIFGADVTHPAPGDFKVTESIAAVVGSLDPDCSYYASRLYAQKHPRGQAYEMIHDLDRMVYSLISQFYAVNGNYPKRLVFFRDGVSEGQFPLVRRYEIDKIRAACIQINASYKPAITFVVVQKRHHTRFFPIRDQDGSGKCRNVPPGTVVDKDVVTPDLFDYFLCSHMGIQGTSKPCRYFILHDDSNFTQNQMQLMSHHLCHIYSRCPRSVSIPAPAYYAHLAAFRGRDYIRPPAVQS